jgi:hypothetical protein
VDPHRLEKKIKSLQLSEGILYICPGNFTQIIIEKLQEALPPGSAMLLGGGSMAALESRMISEGDMIRIPLENPKSYHSIAQRVNYRLFRNIQLLFLTSLTPQTRQSIQSLLSLLLRSMAAFWKNNATERYFFLRWHRNMLQNSKTSPLILLNSPNTPSDLFQSVQPADQTPIVLVGAGISNQKVLPRLHDFRDKIILLTVDTALGAVLDHGMVPDAVIALEGQFSNSKDFIPLGERKIPFIADLSSHPLAPQKWASRVLWTITAAADTQFYQRMSQGTGPVLLDPPGNVGNYAYRVARAISQGPVFLTGMDYWFPKGQSHSKGTTYFLHNQNHRTRLAGPYQNHWNELLQDRVVHENDGLSNPTMQLYRRLMLQQVSDDNQAHFLMGMPHWPEEVKVGWEGLLRSCGDSKPDNPFTGKSWDAGSFFYGELRRLEAFLQVDPGAWTMDQLGEMDYLYHHFPDQRAIPNQEVSFLNRVSEAATVTLNLYRKILSNYSRD